NVVAVSPATTWRVLSRAGLLKRWNSKPSKKGKGFVQPLRPHQHWHIVQSLIALTESQIPRHRLRQHSRHIFLSLQRPRRLQPRDYTRGFCESDDIRTRMTEADVEIDFKVLAGKFIAGGINILADTESAENNAQQTE
ncbi:hypothetical protein ACFL34_04540, partial [Candidatus Sumerlaeota bacterium]